MGTLVSSSARSDVSVKGLGVVSEGTCYAITARYDGRKDACLERFSGQCQFGTGGEDIEILSFERVGQTTEISTLQFDILTKYAHKTEYQISGK